LEKWVWAW